MNNINNIINEKCNHIIVSKKNQNSRYNKHQNADNININNFNNNSNINNLYNSMLESDKKNKKLSVSHNKSKSGTGSIIKFHAQDNNNFFNVKSGNLIKGNNNCNFKKFKSISPTLQRRNAINGGIKEKHKCKSKSQSRSKTKSRSRYNKNDINELNNLIINGKYNNNTSKQKSIKEKMDTILSKNIIALTKKTRKSPSPKIRISRPSLIKNIINNPQNKIIENIKHNNNCGSNIYYNCVQRKKNKNSPSPLSFRINNYSNINCNNKKSIMYINNNYPNQNIDNLLLINNNKKLIMRKKIIANSQNSSEHYDNSGKRGTNQSSSSTKKKNFPFKNMSNYSTNICKNQKIQNKKPKNIMNINRKNINEYKYDDDYNSLNDRKKSINYNKRLTYSKNSNISHMVHNNMILNNINKKNNIIINNIKINNNNNNKKQMTIIQNFSKYKKKASLNLMNNKNIKTNCHNENICNNYYEDNKIINELIDNKKNKNGNINNNVNSTIDEKRKKSEYNHSQPKITDQTNNCYTN